MTPEGPGWHTSRMRSRRVIVAAVAAIAVLAAVGLAGTGLFSSDPGTGTDPHGTALPEQRQVELSYAMPSPSSFDGLHAKFVEGTMPAAATSATVLTDEQCQPDARGVSHCLNRLRLPDGTDIEVRHPHDMSKVPCLAPGEHVQLVPPLAT